MKKILTYLLLAFGLTWLLWIPMAMESQGYTLGQPFLALASIGNFGAFGPLVAALLVIFLFEGFNKLKKVLLSFVKLPKQKKWLLIALIIFPITIGGSLLVTSLFGVEYTFPVEVSTPFILPIVFIYILFLGGPLQEELGWRRILFDTLQNKISPLLASIATGFIWGIWHIPQFFIAGNDMYYENPFLGLLVSTILISIIFGWLYNKTGKSMLTMLLIHTAFNFSHYVFPILQNDMASLLNILIIGGFVLWILISEGTNLAKLKK